MPTKQAPHVFRAISLLIFICYSLSSVGCSIAGFRTETISQKTESRTNENRTTRTEIQMDLEPSYLGDEITVRLGQTLRHPVEERIQQEKKYKGNKLLRKHGCNFLYYSYFGGVYLGKNLWDNITDESNSSLKRYALLALGVVTADIVTASVFELLI